MGTPPRSPGWPKRPTPRRDPHRRRSPRHRGPRTARPWALRELPGSFPTSSSEPSERRSPRPEDSRRAAARCGTCSSTGPGRFIFTTALPPPVAAAALAALEIVDSSEGDRRRAVLRAHADRLASQLPALRPKGLGTPPDTAPGSPIQPFVVGTDAAALALSAALASKQVFVPAIRPPTVPPGSARLRITLSAAHLPADLDRLLLALRPSE